MEPLAISPETAAPSTAMPTITTPAPAQGRIVERGSRDYPHRDGRPMGETDVHRNAMVEAIATLASHYAGQPVYVTGNLLMFYRPGDRRRHVSPDVMVVKGAPPGLRRNYLIWEEGFAPNVVIELTSPSTRREDLRKKFEIYRTEIRVPEYFLFDPLDECLRPTLQGFRLVDGEYVAISPVAGRLPSEQLGLHLEGDKSVLKFYDPATGRFLLTPEQQAEQQRQDAEQEAARLRSELEALRRQLGSQPPPA